MWAVTSSPHDSFFFFPPQFAKAVTTPTCKNTPKAELIQSRDTPKAPWLLNALCRRSRSPRSLHHLLQQLVHSHGRLGTYPQWQRKRGVRSKPHTLFLGSQVVEGNWIIYLPFFFFFSLKTFILGANPAPGHTLPYFQGALSLFSRGTIATSAWR